jgi:hypothetical protein
VWFDITTVAPAAAVVFAILFWVSRYIAKFSARRGKLNAVPPA